MGEDTLEELRASPHTFGGIESHQKPVILDLLVIFHKLCQGRNIVAQPLEQPQQEWVRH